VLDLDGRAVWRTVSRALVIGSALLAGCSTLPELGVCGNGVVETGESCDDGDATALCNDACALVCVDADEGPPADYQEAGVDETGVIEYCPAGYRCGLDEVCRAPSGRFQPPGLPQSIDSRTVELGDFDFDGVLDAVGVTIASIRVRFGTAGGEPLATEVAFPAPPGTGPSLIRDLDEDGLVDIATPSVGGLVLLRATGAHLETQIDLALDPAALAGKSVIVARDPSAIGEVVIGVTRAIGVTNKISAERIATPGVVGTSLPACDLPAAGGGWEFASIAVAPTRDWFAVAATRTVGQSAICVYTHDPAIFGDWRVQMLTGTHAYGEGDLVIADVDADSCDDVVMPAVSFQGGYDAFLADGGACGLTGTIAPIVPEAPNLSSAPPLLAGGDVDGIPGDELVTSVGIFRRDVPGSTSWPVIYLVPPPRAWTQATAIDTGSDGLPDVVAISAGEEDVDVVRGSTTGGLSPYRADTVAAVTQIVAGDFDGDAIGDVAIVEVNAAGQEASVAYGAADSVLGAFATAVPAAVDEQGAPLSLVIGRIGPRDGEGRTAERDALDDLAVVRVSGPAGSSPAAAGILFGTPTRLLVTPRWLSEANEAIGAVEAVAAARINGDTAIDLVPFVDRQLWTWDGAIEATELAWDTETASDAVIGPQLVTARGPDGDLVIGLGQNQSGAYVTTFGGGWDGAPACDLAPWGALAGREVRRARSSDIDGDDVDELVVAYRGVAGGMFVPEVAIFPVGGAMYPPGVAQGCGLGPALVPDLAAAMFDADGAQLERLVCLDAIGFDTGAPDVVALCTQATGTPPAVEFRHRAYLLSPRAEGGYLAVAIHDVDGLGELVLAGDVDGDGLDDIVAGVEVGTSIALQVMIQCARDQAADCTE
jgi:hypothetical protein